MTNMTIWLRWYAGKVVLLSVSVAHDMSGKSRVRACKIVGAVKLSR
jgi:hypothetical protein